MDANAAIERAIDLCGKTQGGLAERAGLSQQYISKLLAKKRVPSIEAAIAISRATDFVVRIRDLLPNVVEAVAEEIERDMRDSLRSASRSVMPDASLKHSDIAAAIAVVGSQAELARRCSCAQQTVSKMLNLEISVTAELAKKIDEATTGAVPRWKLRPDLWDAPESAGDARPHAPQPSPKPTAAAALSVPRPIPAWSGAEEQILPDEKKVERANEGCR